MTVQLKTLMKEYFQNYFRKCQEEWGKCVQVLRCQRTMSLQKFWRDYKVLVVMVPLIGLIHLGWHRIKSSPIFQIPTKDNIPEPDSPALASPPKRQIQGK